VVPDTVALSERPKSNNHSAFLENAFIGFSKSLAAPARRSATQQALAGKARAGRAFGALVNT
jgi:hypothetical protein